MNSRFNDKSPALKTNGRQYCPTPLPSRLSLPISCARHADQNASGHYKIDGCRPPPFLQPAPHRYITSCRPSRRPPGGLSGRRNAPVRLERATLSTASLPTRITIAAGVRTSVCGSERSFWEMQKVPVRRDGYSFLFRETMSVLWLRRISEDPGAILSSRHPRQVRGQAAYSRPREHDKARILSKFAADCASQTESENGDIPVNFR